MPKAEVLIVDGHAYNWQRLCATSAANSWKPAAPTRRASFLFSS
jgi:hypothetical protein